MMLRTRGSVGPLMKPSHEILPQDDRQASCSRHIGLKSGLRVLDPQRLHRVECGTQIAHIAAIYVDELVDLEAGDYATRMTIA
ncbi:hypothetical protein [Breoghania sp. L-A4]|uniref:hypothetical protein n=1 Tax=Breoghania sp. L-A4 TaxID=2304600 RepID=UPI0020BED9BD|nr:hypothetical protein [Breoghania sp. L-A4]